MSPKRKRFYVWLMVMGGVALFVDRVLLGSGGPSSPIVPSTVLTAVTQATSPAVYASTTISMPELRFPRNLPICDPSQVRDLFDPPATRRGKEAKVKARERDRQDENMDRDTFSQQHQLKGVLLQEGLRIAVVGTHWLQVGEELDGCALKSISEDIVRFECYDGDVTLKLGAPPAPVGD